MSDFPFIGKISESGEHPRLADYIKAVRYWCLCRKGKTAGLPEPEVIAETRTEQQSRYYFALLGLLVKYTGHTKDEFHDGFRLKFLSKSLVMPGDSELPTLESTKKQKTFEMSEYIEKIRAWQREYLPECYLPTPEEWMRQEQDLT